MVMSTEKLELFEELINELRVRLFRIRTQEYYLNCVMFCFELETCLIYPTKVVVSAFPPTIAGVVLVFHITDIVLNLIVLRFN